MEVEGVLESIVPPRQRPTEDVVALIRIEAAEFAAHDHLIVRVERQPAGGVVDDVEVAAEVGIPLEALILARQLLRPQIERRPRHEVHVVVGDRRCRRQRLRANRAHEETDERQRPHL
jgi:hypothetical protein